jgi:CO/xanthine dehydrogenase FAD-binding subunit
VRAALSTLEVVRPRRLDEALAAMAEGIGQRPVPLAGGTDLFVYLNAGTLDARRFVDLGSLRELRGIRVTRDGVRYGALTTFREIRSHAVTRRRFPDLAAAAAEIGGLQIQARATIAGNIANASPAGDSLPVLLARGAVVHARSRTGARDIAFGELYRGYRDLALEPGELITAVSLPFAERGTFAMFRKVGTRRAQSISKVVFGGVIRADRRGAVHDVRLAWGSVAPVTLRARATEQAVRADGLATSDAALRDHLVRDLAPIDDIRSDRSYRLRVAGNIVAQFLRAARQASGIKTSGR